jgi:hypothetical protein
MLGVRVLGGEYGIDCIVCEHKFSCFADTTFALSSFFLLLHNCSRLFDGASNVIADNVWHILLNMLYGFIFE